MVDSALKRLAARSSNSGAWLIAALEGAQASKGEGRNDPGWFHPSQLGNECDAYLAFRFLGAPAAQVISANTQRIFDLGHGRDEYLKQDMQNAGVSLIKKEEERDVEIPLLRLRGALDDLVMNPITHERYVVDFKTMRPEKYEALTEAEYSHVLQLHVYMFGKQVYKGYVIYENKGNQNLKIKEVNFDGQLWQTKIVERLQRILDGLEHDFVTRNPVHCSNCPFFVNGVCTSNEIKYLKERSGLYGS
jgi:CRISPR/Cas system-associated exonuclease Cas4 (RecB family)